MAQAPLSLFISYAHVDSSFVDRLEADLRQQGFATWVDRQQLAGGHRWRRELQEAVEYAQVLLIVLSPEAVASENVQIEYDYALDQGKIVIPIYYRQCHMPMELRAIQWINFRQDYEQGLRALLQALQHLPVPLVAPAASVAVAVAASAPLASHAAREAEVYERQNSQKPGQLPASNLPAQLTPLIGRQQEREAVGALLLQPQVRLVTLTGMAGIGKTRLALQAGADLSASFPDGVFVVALAPVTDPEQVVPTILQTLSISDISGQTPLQRLTTTLKERRVLLLLDNFEQVVQAATVVAELLAACPFLKVLVTSRMVLHLRGEYEIDVPPLRVPDVRHLPDVDQLGQYDAVALFLARAQAVKPGFELLSANAVAVAGICARLDGLPLAIELAAARCKYFSPHTLLSRLEQGLLVLSGGARDLPARQQTLRGAIAWSYQLLEPEEQKLFRRCALFIEGCTLQAAEQVATAASPLQIDIFDGLLSLLDKSLLRQQATKAGTEREEDEPRFVMLQTLREFGLEMLSSTNEDLLTRQAHADYFVALAEQAEPHLQGPEQISWLARLSQERENLRAAFSWLLGGTPQGQQHTQRALRLSVALTWFWTIRGYFREGLAFLQQGLADEKEPSLLRANALSAAATLAFLLDDMQQAESLSSESLQLFRGMEDEEGMADSLMMLGNVAWARSDFVQARPQVQEAAVLYEQLAENWKRGRCLTQLGRIDTAQGNYKQAQDMFQQGLAIYQELGDKERLGWAYYLLARLFFLSKRDPEQTSALIEQSQACFEEFENAWGRAYLLVLMGQFSLTRGELVRAKEMAKEGLAISKEAGDQGGIADALMVLASIAAFHSELEEARTLYREALAVEMATEYKEGAASTLEGLASVAAQQGECEVAARLWGAAEALRENLGMPLSPLVQDSYEQALSAARSQANEQEFAIAWAYGRSLSLEELFQSGKSDVPGATE